MRSLLLAGVVLWAAATAIPSGQAHDSKDNPQIGFWKMNVARSTFSSGTGFRSATSRIEAVDGGVKHTVDSVYADGTTRKYEYTTKYDGKDVAVVGSSPYGDTTALTRLDVNTTRTVYKSRGTVTVTQISVVSDDRRTRMVTTKGTNPAGQAVDNLSVYERQ
jgi:hypothetical protein